MIHDSTLEFHCRLRSNLKEEPRPVDQNFYAEIVKQALGKLNLARKQEAERSKRKAKDLSLTEVKSNDDNWTMLLEAADAILDGYTFSIHDPDKGADVVADLCAVSLYDQSSWRTFGKRKSLSPNYASVRRALETRSKELTAEGLELTADGFFQLFVHEEEQSSFVIPERARKEVLRTELWSSYEDFGFHPTEIAEGAFYYFLHLRTGQLGSIFLRPPQISSGRGGDGATRADDVAEVNYCWMGNKALGVALDLHQSTYVECDPEKYQENVEKKIAEGYVLVNLPRSHESSIHRVNRQTRSTIDTGKPWGSEILYLKQFVEAKKKRDKKNLPADPEPPRIYPNNKGILNEEPKVTWLLKQKGKPKDDKTEGIPLQIGNKNARADAKSVMKSSAEEATKSALTKSQKQWEAEDRRKVPLKDLRTAQEWCHLWGHGDGGQEEEGNFVAGSKHCNTEQLAMELGHRTAHHHLKNVDLRLKVTAYLFRDKIPVARWMRYKLYWEKTKIFDHVYDAQSESFNYHEFKILKTTTERAVLDGAGALDKYQEKINEQLSRLRTAREKANQEKGKNKSRRSDISPNLVYKYNPEIVAAISALLAEHAFKPG